MLKNILKLKSVQKLEKGSQRQIVVKGGSTPCILSNCELCGGELVLGGTRCFGDQTLNQCIAFVCGL